jgi:hypothetical protein
MNARPLPIHAEPGTLGLGISYHAQHGTLVVPLHNPMSSRGYTFDAIVWLQRPKKNDQDAHLPSLRRPSNQIFIS